MPDMIMNELHVSYFFHSEICTNIRLKRKTSFQRGIRTFFQFKIQWGLGPTVAVNIDVGSSARWLGIKCG